MPTIKPLEVVVKELNKINSAAVSSSELGLSPFLPDSTDPSVGVAVLSGVSGSMAQVGTTNIRYHRLDLTKCKAVWPAKVAIPRAPTLHEALLRIGKVIGLTLTPNDVEDAPIAFTGSTVTVTLQAKATSNVVSGSVPLTLTAMDNISLPTRWFKAALTFSNPVAKIQDLVPLLNAENNTSVELQSVGWGEITSTEGEFNTQIVFSGKPAYGYVDDVTVQFNRTPLSTMFPRLYIYNQSAWTGTTRSFVQTYLPQMLNSILITDIKDEPVTIGNTGKDEVLVLTAANGTLNVGGKVNVNVYWSNPTEVTSIRKVLASYAVDDNVQQAGISAASFQYLTQVVYPTSIRSVMASYAIDDNVQQAGFVAANLTYLVRKFYPTSIRSVSAYYAVKDTL